MKKAEVVIGGRYVAKVSGKLCPVQVTGSREAFNGRTYWTARNLDTGREITVRSAQRLRVR